MSAMKSNGRGRHTGFHGLLRASLRRLLFRCRRAAEASAPAPLVFHYCVYSLAGAARFLCLRRAATQRWLSQLHYRDAPRRYAPLYFIGGDIAAATAFLRKVAALQLYSRDIIPDELTACRRLLYSEAAFTKIFDDFMGAVD